MTYAIARRTLPEGLQRRKKMLGLRIGAKADYKRPWLLLRDGVPVGFYETAFDAIDASPETPEGATAGVFEEWLAT